MSVSADVSAATAGLNALNTQLSSTTNAFNQARPAALLLSAAGAAIGVGLFEAVKVAASFDQAMADVRAVMSPTEAQNFGVALSDLAVRLGRDTVFSAREAAAGIGELIRAGISAPDVLNGAAAAALNLAAATGISVSDAATVAAQTMNAFGKTAEQLGGVVDTLAGTANATAATMSDLKFGLEVVSATAQTMGLSFEDTSAAIGLFVSAGQNGSTAGTGLRQMLLELIPNTKPAAAEMRKLGIITADGSNAFFDAAGHVKSLADISGILQHALAGMSDEQKIAALNTLFTRDAINSASILARTGAEGINTLTDAISKISAAETARTRLGTLTGALNNLGSSFETVQIIIGKFFEPSVIAAATAARGLLDSISNMSPMAQQAATALIGAAGAIASVLGGTVLLLPLIRAVVVSFGAMARVLVGLSPVLLAIGAATAFFVAAWQNNLGGVRDAVQRLFDFVGPILLNMGIVFEKVLRGDIGGAFETLRAIIGALSSPLATFITNALNLANTLGPQLSGALDQLGGALQGPVGSFFSNLGTIISLVITGQGQQALDFFNTLLPDALKSLGSSIEGPLGSLFDVLGTVFNLIVTGQGQQVIDFFQVKFPEAFAALEASTGVVGGVFNAIGSIFRAVIGDDGKNILDFFSTSLPQAFINLQTQLAATGGGAEFTNLIVGLSGLATALNALTPEKVDAVANSFGTNLTNAFATMGSTLLPFVTVFQSVANFLGALVNVIAAVNELVARSTGQQAAGPFDIVTESLRTFLDFADANKDRLLAAIPGFQQLAFVVTLIRDGAQGISDLFNGMAGALNSLAEAIRGLPALPDWMLSLLGTIGTALVTAKNVASNAPGAPSLFHSAFIPGGTGDEGAGGPTVNFFGDVTVNGAGDLASFLDGIASAINDSTRRVNPPVPGGQPGLVTGVV